MMESPMKLDDDFLGTPIYGNHHIDLIMEYDDILDLSRN